MVRAHEWDAARRLTRAPRRPWWAAHGAQRPEPCIEVESAGSRVTVAVSGDVDAFTAPQVEAYVTERPLSCCAVLELDLTGVSSMGSVGLLMLLDVRRWCLQRGVELRLRGIPPSLWRVFGVTALDGDFVWPSDPPDRAPEQQLALF